MGIIENLLIYIYSKINFSFSQPTQSQWRIVFFIAAGVYIACGFIYAIFSSGERQKWDDPSMDEENAEKRAKKSVKVVNGGLMEETGH